MSKREKRDKIKVSEAQMLKPIRIEDFGSDKDPCFGKLYNLNTSECKRCGDSEICGIVFSQKGLKDMRDNVESEGRYKDLELGPSMPLIKEYISKLKKKGYKDSKILRMTKKKFEMTRDEIKDLM